MSHQSAPKKIWTVSAYTVSLSVEFYFHYLINRDQPPESYRLSDDLDNASLRIRPNVSLFLGGFNSFFSAGKAQSLYLFQNWLRDYLKLC